MATDNSQSLSFDDAIELVIDFYRKGETGSAEKLCLQLYAQFPDNVEVLHMLGLVRARQDKKLEAIRLIEKALELAPDFTNARLSIADLYMSVNDPEKAEKHVVAVLKHNPGHIKACFMLGKIFFRKKSHDDAARCYMRCLALLPTGENTRSSLAGAMNNLGAALKNEGKFLQAIEIYRMAIDLKPELWEAHNNLGNALKAIIRHEEAIECYKTALKYNPNLKEAYNNLGLAAFQAHGDVRGAEKYFLKALELDPDYAWAHQNYGELLLISGDFQNGWKEYEWRKHVQPYFFNKFTKPLWEGQNPSGKRLLISEEGGLGDTLQFIRYIPLLAREGAQIILNVRKSMKKLLTDYPGVSHLVEFGQPVPDHDYHCPMLNLPMVFGMQNRPIPQEVPYLKPDPAVLTGFAERIRRVRSLKVGICWKGGADHPRDFERSPGIEHMKELFRVPGVCFFSLQKDGRKEFLNAARNTVIFNSGHELGSFSVTAAIIANLDMVITCDTSVAHLAGALGRPVWLTLNFAPDWRWMIDKEKCPWYPTMRIFRQKAPGEWNPVFTSVAEELEVMAGDYLQTMINGNPAPAGPESPSADTDPGKEPSKESVVGDKAKKGLDSSGRKNKKVIYARRIFPTKSFSPEGSGTKSPSKGKPDDFIIVAENGMPYPRLFADALGK